MRKPALSRTNRVKRVPTNNLPRAIHPIENNEHISQVLGDFPAENNERTAQLLKDCEPPNNFPKDRFEHIRTPQEWHQEHLEFMKTASSLHSNPNEADELEAAVYFDHAHVRFVFCCTHCLEMLPWAGVMFDRTHVCPSCGSNQTGEQAVRAAYLALLGEKHPNCTLSDSEFHEKTSGLDPGEFVEKYMEFVTAHQQKGYVAERKALRLLKHLFGERVYNQIVNNGETWVKGADGLHYRMFWSRHGNVAVYEHRYKSQAKRAGKIWKPIAAYCGHFGEDYPISDQIIAQICMLTTCPERYTKQANKVKDEDLSNCGPEWSHKTLMHKIMAIEL